MTLRPPLRTVLLLNAETVERWQADALQQLLDSGHSEITLVLTRASTEEPKRSWSQRLRQLRPRGTGLWQAYVRLVARRSWAMQSCPLPAALEGIPVREVSVEKLGKGGEAFPAGALDLVKQHAPDVILRFGFGILKRDILAAARFGVWSYHHGDPSRYRGQPPGFWEMADGAAVTGSVLQCLNEKLDAGFIMHGGHFRTLGHSYTRQLDQILSGSASWLARTFAHVRQFGAVPGYANTAPGAVRTKPNNMQMAAFLWRKSWRKAANYLSYRLLRQDWTIGVKRADFDQEIERLCGGGAGIGDGVAWRRRTRDAFVADPFITPDSTDARVYILAERLPWATDRGAICSLSYSPATGFTAPKTEYAPDFHCSYPSVFVPPPAGELCIPETAESGATRLFALGAAWQDAATVMQAGIVDPTFLHADDRFWMFGTPAGDRANTDLHIWHAESMTGPWTPHLLNPVKTDIRSARPAGNVIRSGDRLLRPAQDCSIRYGGSIRIQRIVRLSPSEFEEEDFLELLPGKTPECRHGLHTINGMNGWIVIDGARRRLALPMILQRRRAGHL